MIKPKPWKGNDLKGEWVSTYKLDGVRMLRDEDGKPVSRSDKPLYNLDHISLDITDAEIFKDYKIAKGAKIIPPEPFKLHIDATFLGEDDYSKYARGLIGGIMDELDNLNIRLTLRIVGYTDKPLNVNDLPPHVAKFIADKIPLDADMTFTIGEPTTRDVYNYVAAVGKKIHFLLFHTTSAPPFWEYQLQSADHFIMPQQFPFGYDEKIFETKDVISKMREKYSFIVYITNAWTKLNCGLENLIYTALGIADSNALIIYRTTVNDQDLKLIKRNIQQQLIVNNKEGVELPKIIVSNKNVTEESHAVYYRMADLVVDVNKSSSIDGKHLEVYACGTTLITSHNHVEFSENQDEITGHVWNHDYENTEGTGFYDKQLGLLWKKFTWKNLQDIVEMNYKMGRKSLGEKGLRLKEAYQTKTWSETAKKLIKYLRDYKLDEVKPTE